MSGRAVVLFDTSTTRLSQLKQVAETCSSVSEVQFCLTKSAQDLASAVVCDEAGVVVLDARAQDEGQDGIALAQSLANEHRGLQLILLGVGPRALMRASEVERTCLLPEDFDATMLDEALSRSLTLADKYLERPLVVRVHRVERIIVPARVSYLESDLRKVRFHLGKEVMETYGKLSDVLRMMPRRFVQCHKSFAVNMGFVEELSKSYALLTTGEQVPVSQKRRRETKDAFYEYVGRAVTGGRSAGKR